ncbi:unnamed protein product [Calypogeia fissa]
MAKANGTLVPETPRHRRQGFLAHTSSLLLAILFCRKQAQAGIEDFDDEFKSSVTQVHVTTLDEVVSVNSSFCVAVFIGLSFSPNPNVPTLLAPSDPHCQAGLETYRYLLVFEVLSFSCFLFSSLIAHGIKLYIVLGNGKEPENVKSASVNNRLLRVGILFAAVGSAVGSIFLTFSLVNIVQIKLGSFTCGSIWTQRTTIPLVVLVSTGVAMFTSSVFLAFRS